jgi:dTDP-4-dehydrorhamnose 3,5-epimerase
MDFVTLSGVVLAPLKRIPSEKGDVLHALKHDEAEYLSFGEAYFSFIRRDAVKGWKKHLQMTLNLIVPVGNIRFILFDDRPGSQSKGQFQEVVIGDLNYARLTIPPGIWFSFCGLAEDKNLLLNISNIKHDPAECLNASLDDELIPYRWN